MRLLLPILCIFLLSSCKKEKIEKLVLEDLIEEKKAAFFIEKEKECKEKAYEEARNYVDSLANKWVQDDLLDTINFPARPTRPERPSDILEKH